MKKFNIKPIDNASKIPNLLDQYAESLTNDTDGKLKGIVQVILEANKLTYEFNISYGFGGRNQYKLFEITLLDFKGNVKVSVFYINDSPEIFGTNENGLEALLDSIVESDEIGNLISHLLRINYILYKDLKI